VTTIRVKPKRASTHLNAKLSSVKVGLAWATITVITRTLVRKSTDTDSYIINASSREHLEVWINIPIKEPCQLVQIVHVQYRDVIDRQCHYRKPKGATHKEARLLGKVASRLNRS
jgi:hypothetical protein